MLFDHLSQTEEALIGHVKAACVALAFLREVDPDEVLKPGPVKEQWHQQMNALNTARVWISMAAESLHDELNQFQGELIEASHEQQKETTV